MNNEEKSEQMKSFIPVQPVTEALRPRAVGGTNVISN